MGKHQHQNRDMKTARRGSGKVVACHIVAPSGDYIVWCPLLDNICKNNMTGPHTHMALNVILTDACRARKRVSRHTICARVLVVGVCTLFAARWTGCNTSGATLHPDTWYQTSHTCTNTRTHAIPQRYTGRNYNRPVPAMQ